VFKSTLRRVLGIETPTLARTLGLLRELPGIVAGCAVRVEAAATWVQLPGGVWLRYEDAFNSVTDLMLSNGGFEDFELDLMTSFLGEDAVVLDIGANVGLYAIHAARSDASVIAHAFEPVPSTFASLEANIFRNEVFDRVVANEMALADSAGTVHITRDFHSSNYVTGPNSALATVEVSCSTVDDYVRSVSLDRVDFIKIDVEGAEAAVLAGAFGTLERFKPVILVEIVEFIESFHDRRLGDPDEVPRMLSRLGYDCLVVEGAQLVTRDELERPSPERSYHNYLFTHPEGPDVAAAS
jgi:FkbM family methyltransferase